jgi:sec-independent protein translocase protein TatA
LLKNFNGWEIIIVLVIILLLFGARKLPDLARSIGASAKEFRKGLDSGMDDDAGSDEDANQS